MVQLADKYALVHVLHKVQCWVVMTAPTAPADAFPHLADAAAALRVLRLRETLIRCGLGDADGAVEQLNLTDLGTASAGMLRSDWKTYVSRDCRKCRKYRPVSTAEVCATCHNAPSSVHQAVGAALKGYVLNGTGDQGAACKVLASVCHILATSSVL